jgi:aquaporin Z
MGLTAIALIYSRWGQRSGAHMNPAVTATFLFLGRVRGVDALLYIAAQFAGGLAGVLLVDALAGAAFHSPAVNYVATVPGRWGVPAAFVAELTISGLLMYTVLTVSARPSLARYTGLCAGALVATYIALEAPVSGMSMNPARSFASAAPAGLWQHLWIYFTAPPAGMLLAAILRRRIVGTEGLPCAKLQHPEDLRCIHCGHEPDPVAAARPAAAVLP